MGRQIGLMTAFLVLLAVGNVQATIIELPLDCAGIYSVGNSWETDFDLDVEFIQIDSVSIQWSGEITGGRSVYISNPNDPFPVDVGILANFGKNPTTRSIKVTGGALSYPDPVSFNCIGEIQLFGNSTWSDLLDGIGHIQVYYVNSVIIDGYSIEYGTVTLNNATLIVDGTLVPEPASLFLLAFGAGGFLLRNKRKKFSI